MSQLPGLAEKNSPNTSKVLEKTLSSVLSEQAAAVRIFKDAVILVT